jgi:hypothetical protein
LVKDSDRLPRDEKLVCNHIFFYDIKKEATSHNWSIRGGKVKYAAMQFVDADGKLND